MERNIYSMICMQVLLNKNKIKTVIRLFDHILYNRGGSGDIYKNIWKKRRLIMFLFIVVTHIPEEIIVYIVSGDIFILFDFVLKELVSGMLINIHGLI